MDKDCMVISFRYREYGSEWQDVTQVLFFDYTPCNYGGRRTWFLCPQCGRRVLILYGAGKRFLCRHCYGLTYSCQQECTQDRLMRKALNLRERLGANLSLSAPITDRAKPKYMHQKTFDRFKREANNAVDLWWQLLGKRFGLFV
jgi:hypothetical protein